MSLLIEILIKERKAQGLTQSQMADKLKIDRRTYQRWENGSISLSQFADACEELKLAILVVPAGLLKND